MDGRSSAGLGVGCRPDLVKQGYPNKSTYRVLWQPSERGTVIDAWLTRAMNIS